MGKESRKFEFESDFSKKSIFVVRFFQTFSNGVITFAAASGDSNSPASAGALEKLTRLDSLVDLVSML